jgi:hypothetical protein
VGELSLRGLLKPVPTFNVVGLKQGARPNRGDAEGTEETRTET